MSNDIPLPLPDLPGSAGQTTQEQVYLRLRNAIMVGAISPGTSLTIRGLAEMLSLSPTPIREAMRRLSSENAVEVLGNRRMNVPRMSLGRFEELVALRVAVEAHAACRALPFVSDHLIERLTILDGQMDRLIAEDSLDELTLLNHDFHRLLYTANPDQASMPLVESIWLQLGPFQRQVIRRVSEYYQVDRHKEILAALAIRDPAALSVAIRSDIADGIVAHGRALLSGTSS
ncbi:GntR family transcriptional regulator [Sulfitobacter aestuarii]|uniref:GntR family transcriptional regulator n=1 Tax=Sulfitobacter aestuarii TaxID=2161676 RepID=A0ABW5U009_9RHOB